MREILRFCNGKNTYLWLKEDDINAFVDIDETVRLKIKSYNVCDDICNKDAGIWYTKGAFGNDGFRRTGVGRNLSKADFYFKKIKNFEQSTFHEIYEALKKSQNEELIREAVKEFCDKGDKVACEFYDERYK